ncbi:MAG: hypothetical protein PW734_08050 [Verrucomicrobium sp.]|nr:hypothetical protein [Verrucomicrobium sp.]
MRKFSWILFLLVAVPSFSFAQQGDTNGPVVITKVEANLVPTPNYTVSAATSTPVTPSPKWLQVNFDFTARNEKPFIDTLQFRVYVEVAEPSGPDDQEGSPALLVGETTFINVPNERDLHGSFFIHPYTIRRFGGENAFSNFKAKRNIRVEALIDGQQISFHDEHDDDANWVSSLRKISGMVLPRDQSPWALVNIDRYPPVKTRSASQ